jgi:hypothetical protein
MLIFDFGELLGNLKVFAKLTAQCFALAGT